MKTWPLEEIVKYAQEHSPYYKNLYQGINFKTLSDLPIVEQTAFWKSEVLTTKTPTGLVFKSGGSTGSPKHSYFTNEEWKSFTDHFGWGMAQGILAPRDRVANLFYVGDMYASFLFIKDSLQSIAPEQLALTQFPIAGGTNHEQILNTLNDFSINVIAGVPTAILALLERFFQKPSLYPNIKIEKILYGGENLYPDQAESLKRIFPKIQIASIGLASVDGGLLGFQTRECKNGEHRVFDSATIIEIVDPDTNEIITEKNIVGKVLLTNLTRKLMPIIRYPAGDMAMWLEDENVPSRKFILQGRAEEAARLGTITVSFEETRKMIQKCLPHHPGIQFQMILTHFAGKDELSLRIAGTKEQKYIDKLLETFVAEKKDYSSVLVNNLIHPLKIEFIDIKELETNTRTGKLKRIIDRR